MMAHMSERVSNSSMDWRVTRTADVSVAFKQDTEVHHANTSGDAG